MSSRVRAASRSVWVLFLAGPVIWFAHFMAVYLVAEAACAADGSDGELLGLPVLATATLAATVVAIAVAAVPTVRAYRHWRSATAADDGWDDWIEVTDRNPGLAFAGFLLGIVFIVAIGFVGIPAAFLEPC